MRLGRQVWVIAHRWAGLSLASFLVVAGITGALLAFYDEIESLIAPQLHIAQPPSAQSELLNPLELRDKVQAAYPGAVINYLPLHLEPGRALKLDIRRIDAAGRIGPWSPEVDEVFIDPYTGRILAERLWGDIGQGAVNVMPFVYRLHYTLLADKTGRYILGIAALIWVLDCFIGFYLTLPARRARQQSAIVQSTNFSWWSRWKPSWLVRWSGGETKLTFDLHRAGGLWLWPILFVFAWSSVSFNLKEVYDPVMKLFGGERRLDGLAALARPRHEPQLDFASAVARARELAAHEAAQRGFIIDPTAASALSHQPAVGTYVYFFSTDRDFTDRGGRSVLVFDSDSGELHKLLLPQGANGANTFTEWLIMLHMGRVWGLPYRVAVTAIGLLVTLLSLTGVLIWMRKRQARSFAAEKASRRRPAESPPGLEPTLPQ